MSHILQWFLKSTDLILTFKFPSTLWHPSAPLIEALIKIFVPILNLKSRFCKENGNANQQGY
jgi:hypothetical protein